MVRANKSFHSATSESGIQTTKKSTDRENWPNNRKGESSKNLFGLQGKHSIGPKLFFLQLDSPAKYSNFNRVFPLEYHRETNHENRFY